MSFGKAAASGAPSTQPKAEGHVGCETQQSSKAKFPRTQAVDCRNHVLTVFDGAVMVGSLVDRAGAFHADEFGGRHLGVFQSARRGARDPGGDVMSSEKTLGISGIAIKPERLRSLQPEKVAELAGSMAKLGQLQPIIVRPVGKTGSGNGYWLIAGRHRLEAAKQLKWPAIRAVVLENVKADMAELIEIDENLIRAELSAAERAIHVGRRKEIYERQHPQTKHGAAPGRAGGGKAKGTKLGSFAAATAKATGQSKTKIKRDATRAKALGKLLDRINGTCLDNGAEMDALRRLPEDEQEDLVARAEAGEQVSAREALAAKKKPAPVEEHDEEEPVAATEEIVVVPTSGSAAGLTIIVPNPKKFIAHYGADIAEKFARGILAELCIGAGESEVSTASSEAPVAKALKPGDPLVWDDHAPVKEDGGKRRGIRRADP